MGNASLRWVDAFSQGAGAKGLLRLHTQPHCTDCEWVAGLVRTVCDLVPGHPCTGMVIDIADPSRPSVRTAPGGCERDADDLRRLVAGWPAPSSRGFVRRLFSGAGCFTVSARLDELLFQRWVRGGSPDASPEDAFCVVACPSAGIGVVLWFPLPERTRVSKRALARWDGVAEEILRGLVQRHEGEDGGSSPPSGRGLVGARDPVDTDGAVTSPAARRSAVRSAMEIAARCEESRASVARAFRSELVAGRWRFLDQFDADGRRYFAWEHSDETGERSKALTDREREVLGRVAGGLGDRAIADAFGCSSSTVATHRLRAMSKLGVSSRTTLAQVFAGLDRLEGCADDEGRER